MADKKEFINIDMQGNEVINLKSDTLNISTNQSIDNRKRIVFHDGSYWFSDGENWINLGTSLIPNLLTKIFRGVMSQNNSITLISEGGVTTTVNGTKIERDVSDVNYASKNIRIGIVANAVSTGQYTGIKGDDLLWYISGGFLFVGEFNISDTAFVSGTQNFWGMASTTNDLSIGGSTPNEPSSLTNFVAISNDSTDANLQIMYNDASEVAQKIDLGAGFKANRTETTALSTIYRCMLYNAPNSSEIIYQVTNKETGEQKQGVITSNLPASNTPLNFFGVRTMGTTENGVSNTGQFDLLQIGVYSI